MLATINQSVPQLTRMADQTSASMDRTVNRAFWLGLRLILIFLAGAFGAALAFRRLTRKDKH